MIQKNILGFFCAILVTSFIECAYGARPSSIALPCKSGGNSSAELALRDCGTVKSVVTDNVTDRVKTYIKYLYEGKMLSFKRTKDKDHPVGIPYETPCNLLKGRFNGSMREETVNHKGKICGAFTKVDIDVSRTGDVDVEIKGIGSREYAYMRGGLVQAFTHYFLTVKEEINNKRLNLTSTLCREIGDDYVKLYNKRVNVVKKLNPSAVSMDDCNHNADQTQQTACQLKRINRLTEASFSYLAICEIFKRATSSHRVEFKDEAGLKNIEAGIQDIGKAIESKCKDKCDTNSNKADAAAGGHKGEKCANKCVENELPSRVNSFFENMLKKLWPKTGDSRSFGGRGEPTPFNATFAFFGVISFGGFFRRRSNTRNIEKNCNIFLVIVLVGYMALVSACSGRVSLGGGSGIELNCVEWSSFMPLEDDGTRKGQEWCCSDLAYNRKDSTDTYDIERDDSAASLIARGATVYQIADKKCEGLGVPYYGCAPINKTSVEAAPGSLPTHCCPEDNQAAIDYYNAMTEWGYNAMTKEACAEFLMVEELTPEGGSSIDPGVPEPPGGSVPPDEIIEELFSQGLGASGDAVVGHGSLGEAAATTSGGLFGGGKPISDPNGGLSGSDGPPSSSKNVNNTKTNKNGTSGGGFSGGVGAGGSGFTPTSTEPDAMDAKIAMSAAGSGGFAKEADSSYSGLASGGASGTQGRGAPGISYQTGEGEPGEGVDEGLSFGNEPLDGDMFDPRASDDPEDYFTRVGLEDSIFKIVEKKYREKNIQWINDKLNNK